MNTRSAVFAVSCLCSLSAHADWLLSDYATAAPDAASADKLYGIQTFQNKSSTTSVAVAAGSVAFQASYASDGTDGYTANVGLLHPLTPDWAEHDLTGVTHVNFEYKNTAKITDALAVSFGSGAYTEDIAKAGTVFENAIVGAAALGVNTTWRAVSLDILDFAPPKWWTPTAAFPVKADMLKRVKNLQFAPKTAYSGDGTQNGKPCTKCVGPDMASITLELRNIVLKGGEISPWPNLPNTGCDLTIPFTQVDDFADGDTKNRLGGYWYTFTDSGSAAVPSDVADKSKGSSKATMIADAGGFIEVSASLNKVLGTTWHDYAGWASLGMDFAGKGLLNDEAAKITGIGFQILGKAIDPAVKTINFKASMLGVADTAVHQVPLSVSAITVEGGKSVCIRPEDLKQPSYIALAQKVPFDPAKMTKLAWEAKITDQKSSAITTATANFVVSDLRFHGSAGIVSGTLHRKARLEGVSVQESAGTLRLAGYQGFESFDVVSLEGRKVASFAPVATVSLALPRGTYLLVAKGASGMESRRFTVLR